jgi:predicted ester cyclase
MVAWRWRFRGTHTGPFMRIPATGTQITGTGIAIYRMAGGQIVERWDQTDALGMLQQLGVFPKR